MRRGRVERVPVRSLGLVATALWTTTIGGALAANAAHADYFDSGSQPPWEACGYCHNADGISASPRFPNLAGQRRDYLLRQLQAFRDGSRTNDDGVMQAQARSLPPADMAAVANHFSALPAPATAALDDAAAATLYRDGSEHCAMPACALCHGEDGGGSAAIPRLAGQQRAYLGKQLDDFAAGRRRGVFDHGFLRCIPASRRQALAGYLSGLGGLGAAKK